MIRPTAAAAAFSALVTLAAPAAAQLSPQGGPIAITAEGQEALNAERVVIWTGDVEALQGTSRLRSSVLKVFFNGKGGAQPAGASAFGSGWGDIQRMEAEGPVYFVTPEQRSRGDRAVYDLASDTITLTGDVVLVQGQNALQGDRLVIDNKTGRATLNASSGGASKGRVKGVFYPEQGQPGAAAAPAPAPAAPAAPAPRRP